MVLARCASYIRCRFLLPFPSEGVAILLIFELLPHMTLLCSQSIRSLPPCPSDPIYPQLT